MKQSNLKTGQLVKDLLGNFDSIIRKIEKDFIILSRVDKPELNYIQIASYLKPINGKI